MRILWYNDSLRRQREILNLIHAIYSRDRNIKNRALYNKYRAEYKASLREAKIAANDGFIRKSSCTPKAVWRIINTYTKSTDHHDSLDIDLNELNSTFVNVAKRVAEQLPRSGVDPIDLLNLPLCDETFCFREVTFNNVRDTVNSLQNKTSRDIYGLNVILLKTVLNVILIPLTKLLNQCIKLGEFPDSLKVASVTPIYKGGDRGDPLNYRPISILPVVSKVLEKILTKQINEHFETLQLFTASQFGFRTGKSTQDAILKYVEFTLSCFEDRLYSAAVFCDLTKAFDCVSHDILVRKLMAYNFNRTSRDLLKSYLSGRCQLVHLGHSQSNLLPISSGVPQGSILGPVLFLIYINDMEGSLPHTHTIFYADDTTILLSAEGLDSVMAESNELISRAQEWFTANELALNKNKTGTLISSLRSIDVAGNDPVKFLGVYLDADLSWGAQGDNLASSLSKICYALRQLATSVSTGVLRTAYFALFHSKMSYAVVAWGHSAVRHRIFGLQRRAVRIVGGLGYREDCKGAFIGLGILTFPCEYALRCLLYVRLHVRGYETQSDIHNYHTRSSSHLVKPFTRLTRGQVGTNFHGIDLYNRLRAEVQNLSLKTFRSQIRAFLVRNAFFSLEDVRDNICKLSVSK